ncbi:hypothetical protein QKW35_16645 [Pontibacterium granulatum]|uniref:hypothetical protein n=1 Tax=Pontibacterium granulatum TaxID=2036029 RepID=UPI00249BEFC7|nr:hypothetical protein [Pontibacterium granulatum]MDI3326010.1 hypothetical protein [Pontibacterium granulatum]
MIIQSSNVQMSAEHEKFESVTRNTTFDANVAKLDFSALVKEAGLSFARGGVFTGFQTPVSTTETANTESEEDAAPPASILVMTDNGWQFNTEESVQSDLDEQREITRDRLFKGLLEAISGRKVLMASIGDDELTGLTEKLKGLQEATGEPQLPDRPMTMMTMTFNVTESVEEYECTNFNSCGTVTTADGREMEFGLELTMERSYSATRTVEVSQQVTFTDPLVINFEGNAADLSDEKFSFDLNADGEDELISYFTNSGMLALDRNEDGVINDGTELFGALSGNGFADLAQYDEDGNNYIDEADSIFNDLKIWTKTEEEDILESLADRDIGAIYLGSTETPFDIKGEDNQHNGRVRASGFYLSEAGDVGTLQQVDMVV